MVLEVYTDKQVRCVRYSGNSDEWNKWVSSAKNGHFLFNRNYMDYHQDRFTDHSLLFYNKEKLVAVLPANENKGVLASHGGLTFGGVLSSDSMRAPLMLTIFDALRDYMREQKLHILRYKAIPYIYARVPSEEDLYALFRKDAKLVRRDVSSTIRLDHQLAYSKGRNHSLKLASKNDLVIQESSSFEEFMQLETEVLSRKHNTRPVHTSEEISLLASRFPQNIRLFLALKNDELMAGMVVYESEFVAHAQYMASSEEGQLVGALDLVVDTYVRKHCQGKRFFDFGISTERDGTILNDGLVSQKEMFGARTVVYDTYELQI